ncbi:hypothetical protein CH380_00175 [Leptospira adleri]|uniref:Uncharacterized protein n=1 Tax=Leptospira adleri TaxID=2023186 RepID=A0A2M9YTX1_9LEPT|nr:hypothetical protein CH380_00175 [Leptospira adleri]PJZ60916.1 hypothetical protein CH376_15830 [Leptospira adleri]
MLNRIQRIPKFKDSFLRKSEIVPKELSRNNDNLFVKFARPTLVLGGGVRWWENIGKSFSIRKIPSQQAKIRASIL